MNLKKDFRSTYLYIFTGCLMLILGFSSCYENEEGCLDPEASNYLLTADDPCMSCCEYPELSISILHAKGDIDFDLGDTIINNLGDSIILLDYGYLLSHFVLTDTEGIQYAVIDSITIDLENTSIKLPDDVVRYERQLFRSTLGEIKVGGDITQLSCEIGAYTLEIEGASLNQLPMNHPLVVDTDSLYMEEEEVFLTGRWQVLFPNIGPDTLNLTTSFAQSQDTDVLFDVNVPLIRGEDQSFAIKADYERLFDDIDVMNTSLEEKESLMSRNLAHIFTLDE